MTLQKALPNDLIDSLLANYKKPEVLERMFGMVFFDTLPTHQGKINPAGCRHFFCSHAGELS